MYFLEQMSKYLKETKPETKTMWNTFRHRRETIYVDFFGSKKNPLKYKVFFSIYVNITNN